MLAPPANARTPPAKQLLARDVPLVFVYWPKDVEAFDPRLHGFAPNPVTAAWNAEAWSFGS